MRPIAFLFSALMALLLVERALSSVAAPADGKAAPASTVLAVPQKLERPEALLERYPPIHVAPRKAALEDKGSYPCSECHDESLANDPRERELVEAHDDIVLIHGEGRLWCTTCHHEDRGMLKSLKGEPIDFDRQFLLCGGCHAEQQHEFFYGAHGKRIGSWDGERHVVACTGCHDAHDPSIKARMPWKRGRDAGAQ